MSVKAHPQLEVVWRQPSFTASVAEETRTTPRSQPNIKAHDERRKALILPREHGAWGLLLVPMVTGAGIEFRQSSNIFAFVLLLTAALTLFWLRTPLESLLGTSVMRAQTDEERREVMFVAVYLGSIAALALSMLLWGGRNPLLWMIGTAAVITFVAQALVKLSSRRQSRQSAQILRMLSEMTGTIGLTSAAPAAYYVMIGTFDRTAWMLWIVNLLFAGNQIHYVQIRIHSARAEGVRAKLANGWGFAVGQFVMAAVLIAACVRGWMPWLVLMAFVPVLLRGWYYFLQKPEPLAVRRLGWSELTQAIVFCALFITTFALAR